MIVIGDFVYPDVVTARAAGWRLDSIGVARRAQPCPRGGRHKATRYPQDGLPRCRLCGEVFAVESAPWRYIKDNVQKPRRTHGNGPTSDAKLPGRPDPPDGTLNASEGRETRTNRLRDRK